MAEPTTPITYNAGTTATRFTGPAFDTCTAPTLAQMTAWKASPYKAIGIYIGGVNRSCAQPQLTPSWVTAVTAMGWRLVPIYLGLQAPCGTRRFKMSTSSSNREAVRDANDAVAKAKALGHSAGQCDLQRHGALRQHQHQSAIPPSCTTCPRGRSNYTCSGTCPACTDTRTPVRRTWPPLTTPSSYARPDALWIARWDLNSSLTGWPTVPNTFWAVGQRGKQYQGDHNETYGGVTLNIDNDRFDAPVASVAYNYTVRTTIHSYSGPSTAYAGQVDDPREHRCADRVSDVRTEGRHDHRLEQADRRHLHHGTTTPGHRTSPATAHRSPAAVSRSRRPPTG